MEPHQQNILTKIINFVKNKFLLIITQLLIITLSFAFGFINGGKIINRPPLYICQDVFFATSTDTDNTDKYINTSIMNKQSGYVASKNGKYYYPLDCSLVNKLSNKNKIYFNTKEEAEAQGYIYNSRCDN